MASCGSIYLPMMEMCIFHLRPLRPGSVEEAQLVARRNQEVLHNLQCGLPYPQRKRLKAVDFFRPPIRFVEHFIALQRSTLIRAAALLPVTDAVPVKVLSKGHLIVRRADQAEKLDQLAGGHGESGCLRTSMEKYCNSVLSDSEQVLIPDNFRVQ